MIGLNLFDSWVWKMAWRDSRFSRKRLFLSMACITFGVAALVAITSFSENLQQTIDQQSKILLGADLVIRSRRPFRNESEVLLTSIGGERARQASFASMVYFPKSGSTRLARIRALEGDFPFYGDLETDPEEGAESFRSGSGAIVDESLMLQFDVHVGDPIKIGAHTFRITGKIKKIPGESVAIGLLQPRVYIPMGSLGATKLVRKGSIVTYRAFFKFDDGRDVEALIQSIKPQLREYGLRATTVQQRKRRLGRIMENLPRFLNLVGFLALLLGGVGVASAIHVYVRQKITTVAVLRCVGAKAGRIFAVYLVQSMVMGLLGSILGVLAGVGVQRWLPRVLADFLPMEIVVTVSWSAVLMGLAVGLAVALLFALLPLISLKRVSPLLTLRSSFENSLPSFMDPPRIIVLLLIAIGIGAFAVFQTQNWNQGLGFTAGLVLAAGLLIGLARVLILVARKFFPQSWPYVWRQGLANLYRPNNQTSVLMLSLGLGTFLIMTLHFSQRMLLDQVVWTAGGGRPNMVLFDVQPQQRKGLADLLASHKVPLLQEIPIVTMRLLSVNGRSTQEIRSDPKSDIPRWVLRREYRSTYRNHLVETERLIAGSLNGSPNLEGSPNWVSLEKGIAEDLMVGVGDELVFDISGVPLRTRVGSIRQVNWQRFQPNFFIVFAEGLLEKAPQFFVQVTRIANGEASAGLQRAVVQNFPNVSAIDLSLVLTTVDAVLKRVYFAIRFVALFSIITGLLVLASSVLTSRYQRFRESVLLRTLGATRAQVRNIMLIEYLFLGGVASLAGSLLALGASWGLAHFVFEVVYVPRGEGVLIAVVAVIGLTLLIGMLNSRRICDRPPLEVLRYEN